MFCLEKMKNRPIILGVGGFLFLLFFTLYSVNSIPIEKIDIDTSRNIPLTLYVINQNFEMNPIDIVIQIDDSIIVNGNFEVQNQYDFYPFELQLTPGIHNIHIISESGGVELKKQFGLTKYLMVNK